MKSRHGGCGLEICSRASGEVGVEWSCVGTRLRGVGRDVRATGRGLYHVQALPRERVTCFPKLRLSRVSGEVGGERKCSDNADYSEVVTVEIGIN